MKTRVTLDHNQISILFSAFAMAYWSASLLFNKSPKLNVWPYY